MNPDDHVERTYREACVSYTFGFAGAFWMTATLLGILLNFYTVPSAERIGHVMLFVALIACLVTAASFHTPVRFYELLEGEYEPGSS